MSEFAMVSKSDVIVRHVRLEKYLMSTMPIPGVLTMPAIVERPALVGDREAAEKLRQKMQIPEDWVVQCVEITWQVRQ
jgi:hypothetical protein